jgi:hypothetical protein
VVVDFAWFDGRAGRGPLVEPGGGVGPGLGGRGGLGVSVAAVLSGGGVGGASERGEGLENVERQIWGRGEEEVHRVSVGVGGGEWE